MTELFEIDGIQEDLRHIFDELKYEAATRPGAGPEVEALFLSSAQKIQEAIELLEWAAKRRVYGASCDT